MQTIAIGLVLKNAEMYLQSFLFKALDDLEAYYSNRYSFVYYIYENNSSDNTCALLKMFRDATDATQRGDRVNLVYESLPANNDLAYGSSAVRIRRICMARNRFLALFGAHISKHSSWTLFIDSDIYFDVQDLEKMLTYSNRASVITCNTVQLSRNDRDDESKRLGVPAHVEYYTANHYYDTYAYVDAESTLVYPDCVSPECKNVSCKGTKKWSVNNEGFVEVKSAWGGFVLVDSCAFGHEDVEWRVRTLQEIATAAETGGVADDPPLIYNYEGTQPELHATCEHILFCDKVQKVLGKPVIVVPTIQPFWM